MTSQDNGFVLTHQPCPCCDSTDAFSINKDGSGYCFSCDTFVKSKDNDNYKKERTIEEKPFEKEESKYYAHRGLSEGTLRFYGVKTKLRDDEPFETGFKYPHGGFKIRNMAEKKFHSVGNMRQPGLYGKDKFDGGSKDSITITEGEYDALSIYQATQGNTVAVSVRSSSQARKDCIADRDYINSFKKIIICFDNDEPGQKAAREVSSLFDFNKVYHVKLERYKDPNDYLQNEVGHDLYKAWKAARRYSPDNIISSFDDIKASLEDMKEDEIGTYPFRTLNEMLFGLHKGEVVTVKSGSITPGKSPSGVGKTEFFRALEYHLLKTTPYNVGIIHLEEDSATTIKAIAGYELKEPAVLPTSGLSNEDIMEGYKRALGGDDRRVHIYSSFELEDEEIFNDNLRFLATVAGCKFIFLDHITWLATGLDQENERRKIDRLSQRLKLLAKELKVCIIMISHTNDDGRTRGSRNIEMVSNTIIHLTRDKDASDITQRNLVNILIEKARLGGKTGPAGKAYFDPDSNCLREFKNGVDDIPPNPAERIPV